MVAREGRRDKVCGDGLIPDALGALGEMGLKPAAAAIVAQSTQLTEFRGAPLRTGLAGACSAGPACSRLANRRP